MIEGQYIISRFQSLTSYMRDDRSAFPNGVVAPANQSDVASWVSWLKKNYALTSGYNIFNWLRTKGWFNSPIGGFFESMHGTAGNAILKDAIWLDGQNDERTVESTLITGDVIAQTPSNLEKMRKTTVAAMAWWAKRAKGHELGVQYLDVIVKNMAPLKAEEYRVPTFYNPVNENDESGVWWKFMKDTGYNSVIITAMSLSITESQKENIRLRNEAARWGMVAKTLGWINFSEPARLLQKKSGEFFKESDKAVQSLTDAKQILNETDDPTLNAKYSKRLTDLNLEVNSTNVGLYNKLHPIGLWEGSKPQSLSGLGLAPVAIFAIKGGVAIALIGVVAIATNSMINTTNAAGVLQREIYKDAQDILNLRKNAVKEQMAAVQTMHAAGTISDQEYSIQMGKFGGVLEAIQNDMTDNAKNAGKTSIMGQAAVLAGVGVVGLIAWKAM